jgi:hypothetical protein
MTTLVFNPTGSQENSIWCQPDAKIEITGMVDAFREYSFSIQKKSPLSAKKATSGDSNQQKLRSNITIRVHGIRRVTRIRSVDSGCSEG